jgi:uncharacterized Ntn-hydrolase superfamily protein
MRAQRFWWLMLLCAAPALGSERGGERVVATYSIVAWDSATGDLGVAVQSKFLGVGAVVPYARAGVGAVATQAWANTTFGPKGLLLLEQGNDAQRVVETLLATDTGSAARQIGVVSARGGAYAFTGSSCQPYAGHIIGRGYTAQGNILAGEEVVKAMARTFELSGGDLADRLMAALDAAERAGGDKRGRQSAALLVVREHGGYGGFNDRLVDIRVDDDSLPLVELHRLYRLWQGTFLVDANLRSADALQADGKYTESQAVIQRVVAALNIQLRDRPDDPDVLNNVAWTLATHDIDRARALELAKRAVKLAPKRTDILDTMAECHFRLGNFDEAIAIESELVSRDPSNDGFWKQLQKFKDAKQHSGR